MRLARLPRAGSGEIVFHCSFQRIQFHLHLLPARSRRERYNPDRRVRVSFPGHFLPTSCWPMRSNRTTPRTQSALLDHERGEVYALMAPRYLATTVLVMPAKSRQQQALSATDSQLYRFLMRIRMGYPRTDRARHFAQRGARIRYVTRVRSADARFLAMPNSVAQVNSIRVCTLRAGIVTRTRHIEHSLSGFPPSLHLDVARAPRSPRFFGRARLLPPDGFQTTGGRGLSPRVVASSSTRVAITKNRKLPKRAARYCDPFAFLLTIRRIRKTADEKIAGLRGTPPAPQAPCATVTRRACNSTSAHSGLQPTPWLRAFFLSLAALGVALLSRSIPGARRSATESCRSRLPLRLYWWPSGGRHYDGADPCEF